MQGMAETKSTFKITVGRKRDRIFGKPGKGHIARVGATEWTADGPTKEAALENLKKKLTQAAEHQYARTYRFKGNVVFCLYWAGESWHYDITSPDHPTPSGCGFGTHYTKAQALQSMEEHVAQYEPDSKSKSATKPAAVTPSGQPPAAR